MEEHSPLTSTCLTSETDSAKPDYSRFSPTEFTCLMKGQRSVECDISLSLMNRQVCMNRVTTGMQSVEISCSQILQEMSKRVCKKGL